MTLQLRLENALEATRVEALAKLLSEICDGLAIETPWLAPTLLLSNPNVAKRFPLPVPNPGELLVHDYQSLSCDAELPFGARLEIDVDVIEKPSGAEIDISIPPYLTMKTALRMVATQELAAAKPLPVRLPEGSKFFKSNPISQVQVDAYLDLSGDPNPLHRSGGAAEALGLTAPVIPGLLLAGCGQALFPGQRLRSLRTRFAAPVLVGCSVTVTAIQRSDKKHRIIVHQDGMGVVVSDIELS